MSYKEKPQIKLYKYENSAFVLQAIIDDYQECSFEANRFEAGQFSITINYNIPNALLFQRGLWVQFGNDSYMFGEILNITDSIGADGKGSQIRNITGYDARYIFKRRIIKNLNNVENWNMTAKGELVMRNLIKDQCGSGAEAKRQLPIINTIPSSSSAIGSEYSVAEAFTNLYEVLVTVATQSEIGWRIKFDGNLTLEFYSGEDRHLTVRFDTDYESLANGEFTDSAESFANAVFVGGKGTGSERDIYEGEIGSESPAGLDRYEAWDNQSSMTTEDEYEAEALSILSQYGQTLMVSGNGLAKCPYEYGKEYNVGDIITIAFSGKSAVVQILSVIEHWAWGSYNLEFSFGKPQPDLSKQLQLMLRKIQGASNKTNATESVKWYNVATESSMPASDVIYNTIGFTGNLGTGKTFTMYLDDEKTGAKSYNIYVKNLSGNYNLTLTTGISGKTNVILKGGVNLTGRILIDEEGNITSQSLTATSTIQSGNNQPVTSGGVADVLALPTDAVLHYSFDEIPDYPDGMAVYYRNKNFASVENWGVNTSAESISVSNGSLKIQSLGLRAYMGVLNNTVLSASNLSTKIIKIKFYCLNFRSVYLQDNGGSYVAHTIFTVNSLGNNWYEAIGVCGSYSIAQTFIFSLGSTSSNNYAIIEAIYIGDGSYSTPVIDNANGQNNAINNGGIASKGVSGKGVYFPSSRFSVKATQTRNPTSNDNFSISLWLKLDDNFEIDSNEGYKPVFSVGSFAGLIGFVRQGTTVYFVARDSTNIRLAVININKNQWYLLTASYNGSTHSAKVYLNGELNFSLSPNMADYQFGGSDVWTIWSNAIVQGSSSVTTKQPALIDDAMLFDRALTETEVMALYLNRANTPKYYSWADWKINQMANTQTRTVETKGGEETPIDEPIEGTKEDER